MSRTIRKIETKNSSFKWIKVMEHKRFRQNAKMRIRAGRELLPLRNREYKARWGLCGYDDALLDDALQEASGRRCDGEDNIYPADYLSDLHMKDTYSI